MNTDELEYQMQRAAERRLTDANEHLWEDTDGEFAGLHTESTSVLAGPYCGCDTCIVREVLDAAWPFMYRLARQADVEEPALP